MHRWTGPAASGRAVSGPAEALGLRIIAAAVRRRRVGAGLSQRQLSYWSALNQSTISRLETGRLRTMRMITLARVIGALNLPPGDLTPGGPPRPSRRLPGEPTD